MYCVKIIDGGTKKSAIRRASADKYMYECYNNISMQNTVSRFPFVQKP